MSSQVMLFRHAYTLFTYHVRCYLYSQQNNAFTSIVIELLFPSNFSFFVLKGAAEKRAIVKPDWFKHCIYENIVFELLVVFVIASFSAAPILLSGRDLSQKASDFTRNAHI